MALLSSMYLEGDSIHCTGDKYEIANDGLVIKEVGRASSGKYTCRARVAETGELEEREILLEVRFIGCSQRPTGVETINNLTCVKNKVDHNPPPIFVNLK